MSRQIRLLLGIFCGVIPVLCAIPNVHSAVSNGALESISAEGRVQGWAMDPAQPEQKVRVEFFVDVPKGQKGLQLFFDTVASTPRTEGGFRFQSQIPDSLGDGRDHQLYAYSLIGTESAVLTGGPQTFNFKSTPPAVIKVLSPKPGQVIKGSTVTIKYKVVGEKRTGMHPHWQIDRGAEIMDMTSKGSVEVAAIEPGTHTLRGYLAQGHHEKYLNSDVSVSFMTKKEAAK